MSRADNTIASTGGLSSVAITDLDNGTDGELITWDSAGAPTTVAVGTATHVLTSNGVGAAPTFQATAESSIIDITSTEAFLVRKDADAGDVFTVDTTNSFVTVSGKLDVSVAKSGTPSVSGEYLALTTSTFTDNNTAGSGTATSMAFNAIAAPTLASTNVSVTTTDASTLYIGGSPIAGTNQTITNGYSLWVDSGDARLDGNLFVNSSPQSSAINGGINLSNTMNGTTPGIVLSTTEDIYPTLHFVNFSHNSTALLFDAYYGSDWTSSDATSNFGIFNSGSLNFNYNGGTTAGNACNLHVQTAISITNSGTVILPVTTVVVNTVNPTTSSGGSLNVAGDVVLGATNPRIYFPNNGSSAPAFTNRTAGTKLVLNSAISGSSVDFALGIDTATLWTSVSTASDSFKWYGGTTNIMTLSGAGNLSISGTVDGIDIATQDGKLESLYTTIGLSALTSGEVNQLENIGATTISATQWGYLGATDQSLATTDNVIFNSAILDSTGTEAFLVRKDADAGDVFTVDTTNTKINLGPGTSTTDTLLSLYGTSSSLAAGPHTTVTGSADIYPIYQQLNFAHDNINLSFDAYFDGDWRSSDATSNFRISKNLDLLSLDFANSTAAGSIVTWTSALNIDATGDIIIPGSLTVGSAVLTSGSFAFANNVSVAADVTGLIFDKTSIRCAEILLSTFTDSSAGDKATVSTVNIITDGSAWAIVEDTKVSTTTTNIVYTITSAGQLQYTSPNDAGFTSGALKWSSNTTPV